jgi:hypothetical protein
MRKRPLLLLLPLVTTIGLITTGCEQTPQQKGAAELKQEWKRLGMLNNQETGQRGPIRIVTFYHVHVMLLRDLLDKTSPAVVEAEFQRICRTQVPDFA